MPASAAHKHKETNLYRFKTFSERLALVNIDAVHKIQRVEVDDDENQSRYTQSLVKWRDLDLSVQFVQFRKEVTEMSKNYKMVIHYRNDIIKLLQQHLIIENTLALQALLELTVALSYDLGLDFYPHFPEFFNILTGLLHVKETDKLEWIFTTISMLFRNLWRYMINDMENILNLYANLLTGEHPDHIGSFAAESISFLLRKSKDHPFVLQKLFGILNDNPQGVDSVGRVLFYIVKSSQHQFHSCTSKVLPVFLSFLDKEHEDQFSRELVFNSINASVKLMAEHTKRQYGSTVWNILIQLIQKKLKCFDDDKFLVFLLRLLNSWCQNRLSSKLVDADKLMQLISKSLVFIEKNSLQNLELHSVLCELVTTVLVGAKSEILDSTKQEMITKLCKSSLDFDCMVKFWKSLYSIDNLNDLVHKPFLQFCHLRLQKNCDTTNIKVIQLIVDYSMHADDFPDDARELTSFLPQQIDFSMISKKRNDVKLANVVQSLIQNSTDPSTLWYAVVVLQHVSSVTFNVNTTLTELISKLLDFVSNNKIEIDHPGEYFSVIAICVQVFVIRKKTDGLSSMNFLPLMENWSSNKHVLYLFDMLLQNDIIKKEKLFEFNSTLEKYVSANCPKMRLLSLRILLQLNSNANVYLQCITAEKTLPTGLDFRSRVLALSKLQKHDNNEGAELSDLERRVVIRFLSSNLYINLTPIWKPVQDILCTHAPLVKSDDFWLIMFEVLENSSENAENSKWWLPGQGSKSSFNLKNDFNLYDMYLRGESVNKQKVVNPRPDFFNYRLLLWKTLCTLPYPGVIEGYNRILNQLLFRYLENEHYVLDQRMSPSQDLCNFQTDMEEKPARRKDAVKLLCTMFGVFARFSDLSGSYQSKKLNDLFYTMLTHSDPQMQEASLKCIMTYKNKGLSKYSEQLFNFFNDKIFRDTLTNFIIADLADEERKNVVPVLVRILFGRMKSKTGFSTGGKGASNVRQSVVVRYLSNVNEEEMQCFINIVLEPFTEYMDSSLNITEAVFAVRKNFASSFKVVPLSRQQGILGTIQTLIKKHNQKLPASSYSIILRMLLCLITSYSSLLESQNINKHFLPALRNLRKLCTESIINLLYSWPEHADLSKDEINVLFSTSIWPDIEKLIHESSGHPTVLLKLIECFTQNVKYLFYLVKLKTIDNQETRFNTITEALVFLLNSPKTSLDICNFILEMIITLALEERLNKEEDANVMKNIQSLKILVGEVDPKFNYESLTTRSLFGLAIISPYIKSIVSYFLNRLKESKRGLSFNARQLELLALLSENVNDEKLLSDLSELLLSHVLVVSSKPVKKNKKSITAALETLSHTMNELRFLPKLSKLFSTISDRESRLFLVTILKQISQNNERLLWTSEIVARLNAWDKRYIEEMDFDSRLTAFQDIAAVLEGENYEELFAENCFSFLPIMHCCVHTILHCYSDISLRESVSRVLNIVIDKVMDLMNSNFEEGALVYQKVIRELLLPLIEKGLKSEDEGCRHETIHILSKLVRVFTNEPALQGLYSLCNLTNPEDDFFENVCHIQVHRRSRALRKVAKILYPALQLQEDNNLVKSSADGNNNEIEIKPDKNFENSENLTLDSSIPFKTATKYLLPIAMQTLHTYNFTKAIHLREACLALVKSCATMMPWSAYKRFLLLHIWDLDRHKTSIDIVCAALTVFPFDLTSFNSSKLFEAKNAVVNFPEIKSDEYQPKSDLDINNEVGENVENEIEAIVENGENEDVKILQLEAQKLKINNHDAKIIVMDVVKLILPKLRDILSRKDEGEEHKLSNAKTDIEQCKHRIPLAIAMVSALRKMPGDIIRTQLSSVILRVVGYLRHKLHDVRIIAGHSMVNILQLLGSSYLFVLVKDMKTGLSKGYQKHVLVHVVNSLLRSLISTAKIGDFDSCIPMLLEIINDDLFGQTADEKGVEKLRAKIPEARGRSKAFSSYKTLARFMKMASFSVFLDPLKQKLDQTHKHALKKTVKDVLTEISHGLMENEDLTAINLLTLVHSLLGKSIFDLFPSKETNLKNSVVDEPGLKPPSCLLLPIEPKRYGTKPTTKTVKTNMHLFVEFSLQLLHFAFKKQIVTLSEQEHLQMLDPLVERLFQCLKSGHQQTVVDATRCLTRMMRGDMPSMHAHIVDITTTMFKILRSHTKGAGNQETAAVSFKSLSVLCSTEYGECLNESQLKVLLTYAEEDLYDSQRQTHAFDLIKSILKHGLKCDEITEVIDKVKKIAIQSQAASSRSQSRSLYFYFMLNHLFNEKKLQRQLEFILAQLSYEFEDGRSSCFELLSMIITSFPTKFLTYNATFIFVPTAASLINDESPKCRKMAAATIKLLLQQLSIDKRKELFSLTMQWYCAKEVPAQQRLASILVSLFAEIETTELQKHFKTLLPVIETCVSDEINKEDIDDTVKTKDHTLYHHLYAFLAILKFCDVSRLTKFQALLQPIFTLIEGLLTHPHNWVRLVCAQIYGCLFGSWDALDLAQHTGAEIYFANDVEAKLSLLSLSFCEQLKSGLLIDQLAEQVIKNLLFIVRALDHFKFVKQSEFNQVHPSIINILKQLQYVTKHEQAYNPKVTTKRTAVLKFCAAACLNVDSPERFLKLILEPVHRGINASATYGQVEQDPISNLRQLSAEVLDLVKNKVGHELFSQTYLAVSKKLTHKRKERKREKAVQLVTNPQKAASFKVRKQERTKIQRKRKIANLRPEYGLANLSKLRKQE